MRIAVGVLTVGVVGACGRIGFDATGTRTDAASDAQRLFAEPIQIVELDDAAVDDDPTLTGDELEIYFNSARTGGLGLGDLWVATRTSTDQPFGAPTNVSALNSANNETTPELSVDGLTMMFASSRPGGAGGQDIYITKRADRQATWAAPQRVVELCSTSDDEGPAMTDDGLTLVMQSRRDGLERLYTASRTDIGMPWSTPVLAGEVDPTGTLRIEAPHLNANGTTVHFHMGLYVSNFENHDIYVATRATTTAPFGAPERLEINVPLVGDLDPWLSPDGNTIYFSSRRSTNWALWIAKR